MAGKHDGNNGLTIGGTNPPVYPGTRVDRAYSEGRQAGQQGGDIGDNPFTFGEPEFGSWGIGFLNQAGAAAQIQTCWV